MRSQKLVKHLDFSVRGSKKLYLKLRSQKRPRIILKRHSMHWRLGFSSGLRTTMRPPTSMSGLQKLSKRLVTTRAPRKPTSNLPSARSIRKHFTRQVMGMPNARDCCRIASGSRVCSIWNRLMSTTRCVGMMIEASQPWKSLLKICLMAAVKSQLMQVCLSTASFGRCCLKAKWWQWITIWWRAIRSCWPSRLSGPCS